MWWYGYIVCKIGELWSRNNNNNNNNNNQDDIYGAVNMAQPLREFTRFIWWMQTQRRGGRQPSDQANRLGLRVRQKEMAATVHIHHRQLLLLSLRADTHFTSLAESTVPSKKRKITNWFHIWSTCNRLPVVQARVYTFWQNDEAHMLC